MTTVAGLTSADGASEQNQPPAHPLPEAKRSRGSGFFLLITFSFPPPVYFFVSWYPGRHTSFAGVNPSTLEQEQKSRNRSKQLEPKFVHCHFSKLSVLYNFFYIIYVDNIIATPNPSRSFLPHPNPTLFFILSLCLLEGRKEGRKRKSTQRKNKNTKIKQNLHTKT